ncbi:hypothetical protein HKD37_09G024893 [Glycine soja]
MLESSKKRKRSSSTTTAVGHRRQGTSGNPPTPVPPSLSSPRPSTLFSSDDQCQRYYSQFYNRFILDPKYLDLEFFDGETFDCYQVFQNSGLIDFMSLKLPYFPELVKSSNLALASKEDLILMWAFQTGRQIDWAHLVRYRMHKALRANAPLLYPHLVTLFFHHLNVPLDDEPFVKVIRSFSIGAGAVTSFGYQKDVDGEWVHKHDLPSPIPDERTPSPPPQLGDSTTLLTEVLTELHDLRAFMGERFNAMDTRLDVMNTCFDGMDMRITRLEDDMSFIRHCFDPSADF